MTTGIVTVLFTDLVGSTALLDRLGDDAYESVRRAHFDALSEVVDGHGGVVVKNLGDGLMVVLESAVNALGCAIAMQQAVERHGRRSGQPLSIRIGLDVGEPTVVDGDYFGTPVVVAKRLCDAANGGQILASALLRDLVGRRGTITFGVAAARELKGLTEPLLACEVEWTRAGDDAALPPALSSTAGSVFVGREAESTALFDLWKQAASGIGQAAFIAGEPGVGKTRLATAVAQRVVAAGGRVLYGRCDDGLGVPYQPFVEVLRSHVSGCADAELREQLGDDVAVLVRVLPELDRFGTARDAVGLAEPEAERFRLFDAVAKVLARISSSTPLLIVLDDLHWVSAPTIALLRHVLTAPTAPPALVLGTYRPTDIDATNGFSDLLADLRRNGTVRRITLNGLDSDEIRELVAASAGHALDERAAAFADALHDQTRGNPFFVREVLNHLVETGVIYEQDGRWTTDAASPEDIGLPEGVREVVSRRLARLSDGANKALTTAAVLGARFSWRTIEAVVGADDSDELLDQLDEAVAAGVLVESSDGYAFTHALVRNTLYAAPSAARRARLHRTVANALEQLPDAGARIDELAFHYIHAAVDVDVAKAAEYSLAAAAQAADRFANEQAIRVLERALDVVGSGDGHAGIRSDLLLALSDVQARSGDVAAAKATAFAAADAARSANAPDRLGRAFVGLIREGIVNAGVLVPGLAELGDEALGAIGEASPALRASVMAGLSYYLAGSLSEIDTAERLADTALELARSAGDGNALAEALLAKSLVVLGTPAAHKRDAILRELLDVARANENLRCWEEALCALAVSHLRTGDLAAQDSALTELRSFAVERRAWAATAQSFAVEAGRALLVGAFAEADRLADEALAAAADDFDFVNVWAALRILAAFERGDLGDVAPLLAAGIEQTPRLQAYRSMLALVDACEGREAEAREALGTLRRTAWHRSRQTDSSRLASPRWPRRAHSWTWVASSRARSGSECIPTPITSSWWRRPV
jgi:class 3 adenylate cyclase